MNNRNPENKQPQSNNPVSACDLVMDMLTHEIQPRTASAHSTVGVDTRGRAIFNPATHHETYDEAIFALQRAEFACKNNLVVSPLSKGKQVFFIKPERYPEELERATTEQKEIRRGWLPGFRSSK